MPQRRLIAACIALWPTLALGHASEQGFVLLLPTDIYIAAGGVCVALTVLLIAALPDRISRGLFHPLPLMHLPRTGLHHLGSLASAVFLGWLIWIGLTGTRDPLVNLLPLGIWTLWWVILVSLQGLLGNHWRWTNPWSGVGHLLARLTGTRAPFRYPRWLGYGPAILGLLGFAGFLLADPAPADPTRLALFVGGYWYAMLLGLVLFGPRWLLRGEALTVLMRAYMQMALPGRRRGRLMIGLPGWRALATRRVPLGLAMFILLLLGIGSFDGLNETFWWLGVLDINPLEFPGRSAVVTENLYGLVLANSALIAIFAACLWLGGRFARTEHGVVSMIRVYAPSVLPIALAYHIAHYLPSLLVEVQYLLKALSDPHQNGADYLGYAEHYVTTGFFNTPGTVRVIWLVQAGVVVGGHVLAILMAHASALRLHGNHKQALLGHIPLAGFMVLYTCFGLWLLASPRGL